MQVKIKRYMIQFDVEQGIEARNQALDFSNHASLVYRATKKKLSALQTQSMIHLHFVVYLSMDFPIQTVKEVCSWS
jgi:hypothetical protein